LFLQQDVAAIQTAHLERELQVKEKTESIKMLNVSFIISNNKFK
jgi:hypothetical protein